MLYVKLREENQGHFKAGVCRRLVKGSSASSHIGGWLSASPVPVLPSISSDFSSSRKPGSLLSLVLEPNTILKVQCESLDRV